MANNQQKVFEEMVKTLGMGKNSQLVELVWKFLKLLVWFKYLLLAENLKKSTASSHLKQEP